MIERIVYYTDLIVALCGFDGSDSNSLFGWIVVMLAASVVVYAFYEAITKMLIPGETEHSHIKYQILAEDD